MASFSPSPAPRLSTRNRPVANSPPRRIRVTGHGRPASRFATPARQSEGNPFGNENVSVTSGMDVDERASVLTERSALRQNVETLFAKSNELTVSFYATLPVEVKQVLKNADFYGDSYSGDIDTLTGFALVASVQTCFVWQHAQAVKGIPTCYIFSCPQGDHQNSPPFHGFIPYGPSREPGLILISLSGFIRFWDSIGIGLAGGDHYTTSSLDLGTGEDVTNLVRSDAQTYIVSTTSGNFYRLTLASTAGKHHLTSRLFSRPTQSLSFSRLIPSIFSSTNQSATTSALSNVSAIALGGQTPTGGKWVWALVDSRVQRWDMKLGGWEELISEMEVSSMLTPAVKDACGVHKSGDIDLELVDLAIDRDEKLVVLVSYAGEEEHFHMSVDSDGVRRIYALVHLSCHEQTFKVESVKSLPHQSIPLTGAPMHPRMRLILGGLLISIQFGDAVVLCARDSNYRDRLELKSNTDRTLGVGVIDTESSLLILTAATMMKVYIDMDKVLAFDPETGGANLIRSIMTQAILYGSSPENPLHFSFPPELDEESLMQGAEQLSRAILESDSEIVRKNHDISAQLTGRKEKLSWLIRFINDNVVLVKMSQGSRQKLATDAEILYACYQLWIQHNDLLATAPTHSVLNDAVHAYMVEVGEGHHEDVMRAFFRLRVGDIGRLIRKVNEVTIQASRAAGHNVAELLPEANHIVITVLQSAFDYREYNLGVYGIELPMIKPWSSRPAIIDVVLGLFDATTKVVDSPVPGDGAATSKQEPNSQLPDLAAILFTCIQERLDWLGSGVGTEEASADRDRDELEKKFALLRPEVLETLRRNGHAGPAFSLAEKYRDFSSLVALCHRDTVYPPEENPNHLRIQAYIDRFKDEFTTELYRWYIQHGELRTMFAQEDTHGVYLDNFFAVNPNTAISWIHDLGKGSHGAAAAALLLEAEKATNLETKHLLLSIGKLSQLAQLQETDANVDTSLLDAFHDDLDFVSVHEALLQQFKSVLESVRGRQSLENQLDIILKANASTISERKALSHIFRDLVRSLLQGKALSIEDAVDILTLKDNSTNLEDYATALHLLARVQNLPEARKASAFRTVWRRIYIHDDWDKICKTVNITDAELNDRSRNTALYSTLCAILSRDHQPEGYETPPDVALLTPSLSEIASRWPGMSPDEMEAVVQDYNLECDKLGEMDLDDVYHRVRELAVHDVWQTIS